MKTRTFTADEMKQAARNALESWDFDNYENGQGILRQAALKHLSEVAMAQEIEIGPGHFADVYDFLSEYAEATTADMSLAYAKRIMAQ